MKTNDDTYKKRSPAESRKTRPHKTNKCWNLGLSVPSQVYCDSGRITVMTCVANEKTRKALKLGFCFGCVHIISCCLVDHHISSIVLKHTQEISIGPQSRGNQGACSSQPHPCQTSSQVCNLDMIPCLLRTSPRRPTLHVLNIIAIDGQQSRHDGVILRGTGPPRLPASRF